MDLTLTKNLVVAGVAAATTALAPAAFAGLKGNIVVDGSSTVYPITEAVAEEFNDKHSGVKIEVGVSGTGGGFKRFVKGETDISNASRPIKAKEDKGAQEGGVAYVEIPVAYDGLTVVVNKANDWAGELTVDQLRKIFTEGGAKTWKEVDPSFPSTPITIFSPGTDSGTFDYFKEVIAGKGDKYGAIRSDMSVSEDDNVLVRGVVGDKGAIGFFGCAYYFENEGKLKAVSIVNKDGEAVTPSAEAIEDGSYNPFSRPLFIYANVKSLARPEVAAFVDFYFENGPELAEEVGYVRLPSSIYSAAKKNVATKKTGTQFLDAKGEKIHGSVTNIYK